ncbi:hypothetical protein GCM10017667_72560 [Streptomyces filamentosus]|uniref:Uncharacterized protein n=1 Tax=Streptomyces filamentosus TaxID=67294 RepID=A0A919BXK8_STRFL|nr:hypothetical protein GCM10017667_72560 [Streptomyces filamentosus]
MWLIQQRGNAGVKPPRGTPKDRRAGKGGRSSGTEAGRGAGGPRRPGQVGAPGHAPRAWPRPRRRSRATEAGATAGRTPAAYDRRAPRSRARPTGRTRTSRDGPDPPRSQPAQEGQRPR